METAAPAGYKLNEEPVSFILSEHPSSQIEYDITGDRLSLKDEAVKVSIPVTKTWVGPVGADAVVVHLLADGTDTGKTITLSADGNWTGEFDNLRKFDDTGEEIWYSVAEDPMDNYVPRYDGSADTGYTITNINTETLEIPVEKRWIGPAAKSVTINLLADGKVTDSAVLNEENEWKHIFTNLPRYNRTSGQEIVYDVKEVLAEGYEQERSGSVETGFTFTNTITGKVSIPVTKKWIGPAADSVTVELLADGVRVAKAVLNVALHRKPACGFDGCCRIGTALLPGRPCKELIFPCRLQHRKPVPADDVCVMLQECRRMMDMSQREPAIADRILRQDATDTQNPPWRTNIVITE